MATRSGKCAGTVLVCEACGARNYPRPGRQLLSLESRIKTRKFCPRCGGHEVHLESR